MKSVLRVCIFMAISALAWADLAPYSYGNYPIFQTGTSDTVVQLNAILPRLKDYQMKAYPLLADQKEGDPIISSVLISGMRDPDQIMHEKMMRFQFVGLKPQVQYRLELVEVSKFGSKVVDQRYFKTMDQTPRQLKFATVSCMCDEPEYAEARDGNWKKLESTPLDAVFLLGDQTYVDSFHYVERNKATAFDIWNRTVESAKSLPLGRFKTLIPIQFTMDDHDAGVDNATKDYPLIHEAIAVSNAIYGSHDIPGVLENGHAGVYKYVKWAGQHFFLLDNRTFRTSHTEDVLYGHFGETQENWLFEHLRRIKNSGPVMLMMGDMWGSPTITRKQQNGKLKRLTESFYGDHPKNYLSFMSKLNQAGVTYVLYSGDIHFSQIISHGPQEKGISRYAPFATWEITSSPMHSIMFPAEQGQPAFWPDSERIIAKREYNFVTVKSDWKPAAQELKLEIQSVGREEKPFFQLGTTISRFPKYVSNRRKVLTRGFKGPKVAVAAFDMDATLRVAPSKSVTASHPTDVYILPNVADKIAELNRKGYFVAAMSNQGGVYEGFNTFPNVDQAAQFTISQIEAQNPEARFHYYDLAEEGHGDYFRKPDVGMMKNLERILNNLGYELDWERSFYIGDAQYKKTDIDPATGKPGLDFTNTDRLFAENLGIKTAHAAGFFKWTPDQLAAVRKNDVSYLQESLLKSKTKLLGVSCKRVAGQ